ANLASALRAPLWILRDKKEAAVWSELQEQGFRDIYTVGNVPLRWARLADSRLHPLADEAAVQAAFLKHRVSTKPIRTLVVANPADARESPGMSTLAPWVAHQHRALLLLTNDAGDNVKKLVDESLKRRELAQVDNVILLGDRKALPMEKRPNPVEG